MLGGTTPDRDTTPILTILLDAGGQDGSHQCLLCYEQSSFQKCPRIGRWVADSASWMRARPSSGNPNNEHGTPKGGLKMDLPLQPGGIT